MFWTSIQLFLQAYALWLLGGSILLNIIVIRKAIRQRFNFVLEKIKLKLSFIEMEFKIPDDERTKNLEAELAKTKKELNEIRDYRTILILWALVAVLFIWLGTIKDRLFKKKPKKPAPLPAPLTAQQLELMGFPFKKEEITPDALLDDLKEIEKQAMVKHEEIEKYQEIEVKP